ncbi:MAG: helix-turn-helix domain-containing protein [Muribaculaceae bacterium]|nr:helix-turn-helix domain-containing protein [Muribaculaceae bacterium]
MERKTILSSPEYWIAKTQINLYNCAENFMETHKFNRVQLANHLGVSKGYVSQLLNGDYDHKLSKFFELALAFGYVPKIEFRPIKEVIADDAKEYKIPDADLNVEYMPGIFNEFTQTSSCDSFEFIPVELKTKAA